MDDEVDDMMKIWFDNENMQHQNRRQFIKNSSLVGLTAVLPTSVVWAEENISKEEPYINFTRDGLDFSTEDYSKELVAIVESQGIIIDSYSNGGVVEQLEQKMANILGKEAAVYMPTGTLANHIAVRKLAGNKRRIIVQAESHLYNDSGDCAQNLSGLNLIPLGKNEVDFDLSQVKEVMSRTEAGRVKTGVGAISVESPVRRQYNKMFSWENMVEISAYAHKEGIGMHLDGARLFNACVHMDRSPKEVADLFDTVYVSLYKDFNAASGAILAGSKEFCRDLYQTRRMFGGSMPNAWPFAAVALVYVDSFLSDYNASLDVAGDLFKQLESSGKFKAEFMPDGTNVMKLHVLQGDPVQIQASLKERNIYLNQPTGDFKGFYIKVNPSILRTTTTKLAAAFLKV